MTKVSVIMPVYNAEQHLEGAVRSVLNQTAGDLELIMVDDMSADNSRKMIRQFGVEDQRIVPVFLEKNAGSAGARNAGLKRAVGRYIAFLDSDDLWEHNKLERQLAFMQAMSAPVAFSAYQRMTEDGQLRGVVTVPGQVDYNQLLRTNVIGMLTAVYDREQVGLRLLPDIRLNHDYALWLDILRDGHLAFGQDEVLAKYRVTSGSISRNKLHTAGYQWRVYRGLEQLSLTRSMWYFMQYAWNGYRKSRI